MFQFPCSSDPGPLLLEYNIFTNTLNINYGSKFFLNAFSQTSPETPPPPINVDYVIFLLYQLWHISWKEGENMNGGLIKIKKGTLDFGGNPSPHVDLIQFFKTSLREGYNNNN